MLPSLDFEIVCKGSVKLFFSTPSQVLSMRLSMKTSGPFFPIRLSPLINMWCSEAESIEIHKGSIACRLPEKSLHITTVIRAIVQVNDQILY